MVNRFFFLIIIFFSLLHSSNILQKVKIEDGLLKLYFKTPLKKEELNSFIISTPDLTKYIFDFKNSKKAKGIKYRYLFEGDLESVRISQYRPNIVRVVIDSKKRYLLRYSQKNDAVFKITLPLYATLKKAPLKPSKPKVAKKIKPTKEKKVAAVKKSSSKASSNKVSKKRVTKKSNSIKPRGLKKRYTIVIDPGHGGKKAGTVNRGVKEKDVVLQIAKRVYRKLKRAGFNVKMTRYKDKHIGLLQRTRIANRVNADIFVSIHGNSISNRKKRYRVRGVETYFLKKTKNKKAIKIAAKENKDILSSLDRATRDVLLNEIFTGPKIVLSNKLAIDVQRHILSSLRSSYRGVKDNGVKGGPFLVLAGAQMPSILVEVGYLSNPKERRRLLTPKYQDKVAQGIVDGIISYLKNREKELE